MAYPPEPEDPFNTRPAGAPSPYGQQPPGYGQPYGQAPYGQAPYGQAPYGQTPYGYGMPQGPYQPVSTSGFAITSMVLGILGLLLCFAVLPSLLAVIFGHLALSELRVSGRQGRGMAIAGLVCGYIGLALALTYWTLAIIGMSTSP